MENNFVFYVQGSAPEPYKVTFNRLSEKVIAAYCTCPAGQNGMYCKHRFNIMNGKMKGLVGGNPDDISTVISWLPGSEIEAAFSYLFAVEKEVERAKKKLSSAKKALATTMRGLEFSGETAEDEEGLFLEEHEAALLIKEADAGEIDVEVHTGAEGNLACEICLILAKKILSDEKFQAEINAKLAEEEGQP